MSFNCGVVKKYVLAMTAVLLVFATLGWAADEKSDKADSDIAKRMDKAADVLKEIESAPDNGIPDNILGSVDGQSCHRIRRQPRKRRGHLPDRERLERPCANHSHRWKLGSATRRPSG